MGFHENSNVDSGDSLVVLGCSAQGYHGLLWEISWIQATPTDVLPFGMENIPKIIQRSGLPHLPKEAEKHPQLTRPANILELLKVNLVGWL